MKKSPHIPRLRICILLLVPILAGVAFGQLTASPTTVNFGTVIVGTSLTKSVRITNTSASTIKVSNIGLYGTGFSVKGFTLPLLIAAGTSSTFDVVFNPLSGISSTGGAVIVSDAANSPQRVSLSGVGWVSVKSVVPETYLGLLVHPEVLTNKIPWPTIPFVSVRLWASQTQWAILNPSEGAYDWSALDSWFNISAQNGKTDLMYTFGVVPQWASSNPNDQVCVSGYSSAGSCDAPYDVNPDGSGTDKVWQDFVTALVNHAAGRIKYWEMWNEPDCPYEWNGTNAQLVRMAKDAYAIIKGLNPASLVTTPSVVNAGSGRSISKWLPAYLAAGGGRYADVVAFHGYINPALGQQPEAITSTVDQVTASLTAAVATKPVWNTEGGWTQNSNLPDADLEAAFVARVYLLQWFKGVGRFYWFQYGNSTTGSLWTSTGNNEAGVAYEEVYNWLVGATLTGPCSATGSVWTCSFTKTGGIRQLATWDASKTCAKGICTTSNYTPSTIYLRYTDLAGRVHAFAPGTTIQIGAKPILLDNQ